MWHGILVDASLQVPSQIEQFDIFARKVDDGWLIAGIEVEDEKLGDCLGFIQRSMRGDAPFYAHFYRGDELLVLFQQALFRVKCQPESWTPVIEYGCRLGIPLEQLQFFPTNHEQELLYFGR